MYDWNDNITFTRKSNFVVENWTSGIPTVVFPTEPAFLEVSVSGITPGTLLVTGTNESNEVLNETFLFTTSASSISNFKFKSITSLTPSWSSYTVNIKATDMQGAPILSEISYGPFLCSFAQADSYTPDGALIVPGQTKGRVWRVSIFDFEPQTEDTAVTGKGLNGVVSNVALFLFPNFPTGWSFFLEENPS
jgi:hypothetical protein